MNLYRTIIVAFRALRRNPTRAALTTLGIVIGIAAVITMMEIGKGSSSSIRSSIEKMGANSAIVLPGWRRSAGVNMGSGTWMSLLPDDADAIRRECRRVSLVAPGVSGSYQLVFGSNNWLPSQIIGTSPEFFTIRNWQLDEGRFFTQREVDNNATVCLVGATVIRELFGGLSPVDCEMRIRNTTFKVIGALKSKGANMMGRDEPRRALPGERRRALPRAVVQSHFRHALLQQVHPPELHLLFRRPRGGDGSGDRRGHARPARTSPPRLRSG